MKALLDHEFDGACPDEVNGWDSRDPECSACQRLTMLALVLSDLRECYPDPLTDTIAAVIDRLEVVLEPADLVEGSGEGDRG